MTVGYGTEGEASADPLLLDRLQFDGDAYRALRSRRAVRGQADRIAQSRASRARIPVGQSRGQGADPGDRRPAADRGGGDVVVPGAALSGSRSDAAIRRY